MERQEVILPWFSAAAVNGGEKSGKIPAKRIISARSRHAAFFAGFLPLMDNGAEFAAKRIDLCEAHLSGKGTRIYAGLAGDFV